MKLLRHLSFLFIFLLAVTSLRAQVLTGGLDSVLRHTLDSMRSKTGAMALSAAIQFSDGGVWAHANGISSVMPPAGVTTDDVFLIGSVTKTITSACVLQLAQQGILHLDDSLHQWLPAMAYVDPNITIRQLLQHTSGLYDALTNPRTQDSLNADITRIWTAEEMIGNFMGPELFRPGTGWSYSNSNYMLLGMIIKAATGNMYYTELRNRFYTPYGLSSFAIPSYETINSPIAHVWLDITGDKIPDDANDYYMNNLALNSAGGACGGYFATPTDCTKWMRKYMRGDVLSPAMMAEAKTTVFAQGSQGGLYGLGLMKNKTDFLGQEAYGHGGDLAYHASSWYFPAIDASITVFTNDNDVNSWALIPVVRELLRTYLNNKGLSVGKTGQIDNVIKVKAYPNPFTSRFTMDITGAGTDAIAVTMKDVTGKTIEVKTTQQNNSGTITVTLTNLDALQSGVYFVNIKAESGWSKTVKMIK